MPLVPPQASRVDSNGGNNREGEKMTDFKVGDKVTWDQFPAFGVGTVVGQEHVTVAGQEYDGTKVRFADYKSYDDTEGDDCHIVSPDRLKTYRTLAEKRQDDFKVLEEASRPWRNAPDYYKFPHDVQTTDISMHLNSNGGQAVGYISRSTRIDGQNKEDDPRESLRKAIDLIQMEIYRLDEKFGDAE